MRCKNSFLYTSTPTHQDVLGLLQLLLELLDVAVSLLHLLLQQLHLLVHLPLLLSHLHQLLELPVPFHQQLQDLRTNTQTIRKQHGMRLHLVSAIPQALVGYLSVLSMRGHLLAPGQSQHLDQLPEAKTHGE